MTEDEIKITIENMIEYFGELPHPAHEPKRFAYYVKLYMYFKGNKNE